MTSPLRPTLWILTTFLMPAAYAGEGSPLLGKVFELREERNLRPLRGSPVLDRIAARAAQGNLNRTNPIQHTDAEGKNLPTRTEEEGYQGATGEIVAVRLEPCSDQPRGEEFQEQLGDSFKEMVRESTPHYRGLTSQTGIQWTEYGYSLMSKQTDDEGMCVEKFSLTIVLGRPSRPH